MSYCAHCIDNPIDCIITWNNREYRVCFPCADVLKGDDEEAIEERVPQAFAPAHAVGGVRPMTSDEKLAIRGPGRTFAARRYHNLLQKGPDPRN